MNKRPNIGEIWDQLTVEERALLVGVLKRWSKYKHVTMGSLAFISVGVFFDLLNGAGVGHFTYGYGTKQQIRAMLSKAVNAQRRIEARGEQHGKT